MGREGANEVAPGVTSHTELISLWLLATGDGVLSTETTPTEAPTGEFATEDGCIGTTADEPINA